jgi:hypothetical protein
VGVSALATVLNDLIDKTSDTVSKVSRSTLSPNPFKG